MTEDDPPRIVEPAVEIVPTRIFCPGCLTSQRFLPGDGGRLCCERCCYRLERRG